MIWLVLLGLIVAQHPVLAKTEKEVTQLQIGVKVCGGCVQRERRRQVGTARRAA
jgi:hypothetical protein